MVVGFSWLSARAFSGGSRLSFAAASGGYGSISGAERCLDLARSRSDFPDGFPKRPWCGLVLLRDLIKT
jgi:hypothetical protein